MPAMRRQVKHLRAYRKAHGLSVRELARMMDTKAKALRLRNARRGRQRFRHEELCQWETESRSPSVTTSENIHTVMCSLAPEKKLDYFAATP